MEEHVADRDHGRLEADFETMIADDDDTAGRIMLAAGIPIHVVRAETPTGYVVRVHPDGSEEVVPVDRDAAAQTLGS